MNHIMKCHLDKGSLRAIALVVLSIALTEKIKADELPASLPRVKIAVSKETTHLLEPLGPDGYVDYLTAMNRMASEGVTTQNNAGVLFVRAFGAPLLQGAMRARFFQLLGTDRLPPPGDYFKEFDPPLTKKEQADFDACQHEPWEARKFRRFADWLKSNERPLTLVVAGTERERCYLPLVLAPGKSLIFTPLPVEEAARDWSRALALRAMLRLGERNIVSAEDDLISCHRLARLIGRSPCLISALVCGVMDKAAFEADAALMEAGKLNAREALSYQVKLRGLPPLPVVADKFDRFERIAYLDAVLSMLRSAASQPEMALRLQAPDAQLVLGRLSDYWTGVFRAGNGEYDTWAAAARRPAPERLRAFEILGDKLKQDASDIVGKELFDKIMADPEQAKSLAEVFRTRAAEFAADPAKADRVPGTFFKAKSSADQGRLMGTFLICLLMPAINSGCAAEDRANARETLAQVGLALAAFHADRGAYPLTLKLLVPDYLAVVPKDPCTEGPLRYLRQADGFLLYSLGSNQRDDDGRSYESQPPGDDITLQIPRRSATR